MRTHSILGIAIAVIASSPLSCQGLGPKVLPADTQFVAHFDLQKCAAVIGKDSIRSILMDQGGSKLQEVLDRAESKWNFDPMRDLIGVTVFGSNLASGREPTVMLWASDRIDGMVEKLEAAGVFSSRRNDGVRLTRVSAAALAGELGIDEGKDSDEEGWIYIHSVGNQRAVLMGEKPSDIFAQAQVLQGEAKSLADAGNSFITGEVAKDSIIFLEVDGSIEGLIPSGPASQIADRARGLEMAVWEEDGELEANALIDLGSDEEAKNIAAVIKGLSGLAALTAGESGGAPEELKKLLESLECKAEGTQVSLRAYFPVKEVLNELMQRSGMAKRGRGR